MCKNSSMIIYNHSALHRIIPMFRDLSRTFRNGVVNMVSSDDLVILSHLRRDSRTNLSSISKFLAMPVSTVFDKIKRYNTTIITRNTVLIDFKKLGYQLKISILLKAKSRDSLKTFLESNFNVNRVYRVNNGFDFIVEAIFKDLLQVQDFEDSLEPFGIQSMQQYYMLEEIKEEGFFSEPELVNLV